MAVLPFQELDSLTTVAAGLLVPLIDNAVDEEETSQKVEKSWKFNNEPSI